MPESFRILSIIGFDGKPIKNTLVSMGGSYRLAIVFPGVGYTCQMPLLYYTTKVLLGKGYDVLWVEYNYRNEVLGSLGEQRMVDRLNFDAEASYTAAMSSMPYREVLLVGKSLGSYAVSRLAGRHAAIGKTIWLTPLLLAKGPYVAMQARAKSGLFMIGTRDAFYDRQRLSRLGELGAKVVIVKGADHSMELPGDSRKSLKVLGRVVGAVSSFC